MVPPLVGNHSPSRRKARGVLVMGSRLMAPTPTANRPNLVAMASHPTLTGALRPIHIATHTLHNPSLSHSSNKRLHNPNSLPYHIFWIRTVHTDRCARR